MKARRALLLLCVLEAACGGDSAAPDRAGVPASVMVVAGDAQTATVGMPLATPLGVVVKDAGGRPVSGVRIDWDVTEGGGFTLPVHAVTDAAGNAGTTWYLGPRSDSPHRLLGRVTSTLAASFNATAIAPRTDSTYFGRQQYIEYRPGELPLIISAPHGGTLTPAEVPDRTTGTFDRDTNAEETVRAIADAFQQRTGKRPHTVISRLRRIKLDPNREITEAAGGNVLAEHAWREWHTFLAAAHATVERGGAGFYIDFHGHGHPIARLELGYLLSAADLGLPDATLAGATYVNRSSIRALVQRSGHSFVSLLRGDQALGTLLQTAGYAAVAGGLRGDAGQRAAGLLHRALRGLAALTASAVPSGPASATYSAVSRFVHHGGAEGAQGCARTAVRSGSSRRRSWCIASTGPGVAPLR